MKAGHSRAARRWHAWGQPCRPSLPLVRVRLILHAPRRRPPPSCPWVQPGDELFLRCAHIDVRMGVWRLEPVHHSQVSTPQLRPAAPAANAPAVPAPLLPGCMRPLKPVCRPMPAGVDAAPGQPAALRVRPAQGRSAAERFQTDQLHRQVGWTPAAAGCVLDSWDHRALLASPQAGSPARFLPSICSVPYPSCVCRLHACCALWAPPRTPHLATLSVCQFFSPAVLSATQI